MDQALTTPKPVPITAAEFSPKWLRDQRATVIRDNHQLRPAFPASIEVKGTRCWYRLMLPNNGFEFATTDDRDIVLRWLTGEWEVPS